MSVEGCVGALQSLYQLRLPEQLVSLQSLLTSWGARATEGCQRTEQEAVCCTHESGSRPGAGRTHTIQCAQESDHHPCSTGEVGPTELHSWVEPGEATCRAPCHGCQAQAQQSHVPSPLLERGLLLWQKLPVPGPQKCTLPPPNGGLLYFGSLCGAWQHWQLCPSRGMAPQHCPEFLAGSCQPHSEHKVFGRQGGDEHPLTVKTHALLNYF